MNYLLRILIAAAIGMLFLQVITACGNDKQDKEVWSGELADGTIITEKGLSKILRDHWQWILEWRKAGGRANLSRANLSRANLRIGYLYNDHPSLRGEMLNLAYQLCEVNTLHGAQMNAEPRHKLVEHCPDLLQLRPPQPLAPANNAPYGAIHVSKNVWSLGSAFLFQPLYFVLGKSVPGL